MQRCQERSRKLPVSTALQSVINLLQDTLLAVHDRAHKFSFLLMLSWPRGQRWWRLPRAAGVLQSYLGTASRAQAARAMMPSDWGSPDEPRTQAQFPTARTPPETHTHPQAHTHTGKAELSLSAGALLAPVGQQQHVHHLRGHSHPHLGQSRCRM